MEKVVEKEIQAVEFIGLSNDEKKVVRAYDAVVHKGLALFKGKPLKEPKTVPSDEVEALIQEMLGEQIKDLRTEFKAKFKVMLTNKAKLDSFITEQQKIFNRAVVAKKKEFTKEANEALKIIGGIEELKTNFIATLNEGAEENVD
tara:strand:+ start:6547 stop:6981 length:435 start_codon:yes stop_codon:yes gene_type:complete